MNRKRSQSILEYVIVLTAIVAAVLVGAKYIKTKVSEGLDDAATTIDTASQKLSEVTP